MRTLGSLKCKVTGLFKFWMWNIYLSRSAALGGWVERKREEDREIDFNRLNNNSCGSTPRSPPSWTCPVKLKIKAPGWHPDKLHKSPPLTLFHAKEQWLYSEPPPDVRTPHLISEDKGIILAKLSRRNDQVRQLPSFVYVGETSWGTYFPLTQMSMLTGCHLVCKRQRRALSHYTYTITTIPPYLIISTTPLPHVFAFRV